ncbi:MaoC family dehydratase N-terminal domain-containing protein [Rugosimonospora acidiphila]|uniref:MaoC family dehydratase N-terminal domain-containing protein n=1 Tax=Rugosimonospora acidiphila TaxID=556531 RepID=A0ABP9RNC7_9ACTN
MSSPSGRTGQPYEFPVERGKVREFARATKARRDSYFTDPHAVVPPTFLMSSAFWAGPGASALGDQERDMSRILHGEQEFVYPAGPPRAGTPLIATQRVEDVYSKQGRRGGTMEFTVLVTEYRDEHGTLVAEARSTVIETSQAPEREAAS